MQNGHETAMTAASGEVHLSLGHITVQRISDLPSFAPGRHRRPCQGRAHRSGEWSVCGQSAGHHRGHSRCDVENYAAPAMPGDGIGSGMGGFSVPLSS